MKFFRYTALDSAGLQIQGTVQAASANDVQRDLASKGYRLQQIDELGGAQTQTPIIPQPQSQPRPQVQFQSQSQVQRPQQSLPSNSAVNKPPMTVTKSKPAGGVTVRTKAGTDKQRFFLFSQLASAFRAGLNPAYAFTEVSQRSADQFRESLQYASAAATEGTAISEVFARYPDLYPQSVVGITRAGEAAGFLPDALDEVARQAEAAHAFRRWFFWVWFLIINFILSVPLMKVTVVAVKADWDRLNASGGQTNGSGFTTFFGEMLRALIWPWGPVTLLSYFALLGFNRWMASRSSEPFRHKLGLKIPVYGKRALQENLARFSWTMSRVSRAGISPARAWQLASESVPNTAFRDELLSIGGQLRGSEKMSDLFFRTKLFPEEYAPMIATAEYTGDLSGALEKLSQISAGEYVAAQNYAKARSGCWGFLAFFITSTLLVGMLLKTVSVDIPQQIMQDTDEGK